MESGLVGCDSATLHLVHYDPSLDMPFNTPVADIRAKTAVVQLKRFDGKWWELGIIAIIGPDGVNECRAYF